MPQVQPDSQKNLAANFSKDLILFQDRYYHWVPQQRVLAGFDG